MIKSKNPIDVESLSLSVRNFGAYSLCNFINFSDTGIPFLMTENVRHNYIDWNIRKFIDMNSHEMLYKSHCNKGEVLITMAGEYLGRVAVYNKDTVCSSNQAIAKVTLKDSFNPYIISTFLNTKHGQNQINRFRTITGQPNINMSLIKSLLIPEFSSKISKVIEDIILESELCREKSCSLYRDMEKLLLKNIGLYKLKKVNKQTNIISSKKSLGLSGRIDAEYYHPKYEFFESIVRNQAHTQIKTEYLHVTKKSSRSLKGYNYIEIGDVNVSDGSHVYNYIATEKLPANAKTRVIKGDILISKVRPNRGAITIINSDENNIIVSGAFTVLRKDPKSFFNNEVLKVLLRSPVYKEWLLKFNVGTSYPVIKDIDILNLPIPIIPEILQQKVSKTIDECFFYKNKCEKLLIIAKKAVEVIIEYDEEKALNYIKENI